MFNKCIKYVYIICITYTYEHIRMNIERKLMAIANIYMQNNKIAKYVYIFYKIRIRKRIYICAYLTT